MRVPSDDLLVPTRPSGDRSNAVATTAFVRRYFNGIQPPVVAATPPVGPCSGQLWWDTNDGQLYIWTGCQWVAASCCEKGTAAATVTVGPTPPANPVSGELWFDSVNNQLNVWDGTAWISAVSVMTPAGPNGAVQFNDNGAFGGTGNVTLNPAGQIRLGPVAVASLPAASSALVGARATVLDAVNRSGVVQGGGANTIPVFCDGANWVSDMAPAALVQPAQPTPGDLWWDTGWSILRTYYNGQWRAGPLVYFTTNGVSSNLYNNATDSFRQVYLGALVSLTDVAASNYAVGTFQYHPSHQYLRVGDGTNWYKVGSNITPYTVAQLAAPGPATQGNRATVIDALNRTGIVQGGGANVIPVFCDGGNWRAELGPTVFFDSELAGGPSTTPPPDSRDGDIWLSTGDAGGVLRLRNGGVYIEPTRFNQNVFFPLGLTTANNIYMSQGTARFDGILYAPAVNAPPSDAWPGDVLIQTGGRPLLAPTQYGNIILNTQTVAFPGGNVIIPFIRTSDPLIDGALWSDNGFLRRATSIPSTKVFLTLAGGNDMDPTGAISWGPGNVAINQGSVLIPGSITAAAYLGSYFYGTITFTGSLSPCIVNFETTTVNFTALPTTNPGVAGRVWNNGGVMTISAG